MTDYVDGSLIPKRRNLIFRFYFCASAVLDRPRRHRGRQVSAAQPLRSELKPYCTAFLRSCYIECRSSKRASVSTFVFWTYHWEILLKNEAADTHSVCAGLFVTLLELGVLSSGFSPSEFLRRNQRRWRLPGMLHSKGFTFLCAWILLWELWVVV